VADIANMTLVGRLTRDPEARFTPNARMNVQFSIAVNRRRSAGRITGGVAGP
jgi:single-stranded DNA-binding protein